MQRSRSPTANYAVHETMSLNQAEKGKCLLVVNEMKFVYSWVAKTKF